MNLIEIDNDEIEFFSWPDECPHCHKGINPIIISYYHYNQSELEVFFHCPISICQKSFIAYFNYFSREFIKTSSGNIKSKVFQESINSISPLFENIYNESYAAEQQNLLEICGVGYRKALEFLIKDYSISKHPTEKYEIEKIQLAPVIKKYVTDNRIIDVAKRAAWLGNDETHYIRKWEGKNLADLKKLIDLTVHWIEMEVLTESFKEDMPD